MQEKTLKKFSLIAIIIGLTFLFFYSERVNLNQVENLDHAFINEKIIIEGTLESIQQTEKATFLKISGNKIETFDVILFPNQEINLEKGNKIIIKGKVEEYNGKKEIIADEITHLS